MIESDIQRLAGVVALLARGYADQIVLGANICFKMLTRGGRGRGYVHLAGWVLPTLSEIGISESDIAKVSATNPARLVARVEN